MACAVLSAIVTAAVGCGESRSAGAKADSSVSADAGVLSRRATNGSANDTSAANSAGALEIHTIGKGMALGLARDTVYMGLSDSVLTSARAEMAADKDDSSAVGSALAGMIKKQVGAALGTRVKYPISDIQSVRYENGEIKFEYRHKHAISFESVSTDSKKALANFKPEDARRFVSAVNAALRADDSGQ